MKLQDNLYDVINNPDISEIECYNRVKKIMLNYRNTVIKQKYTFNIPFNEDVENASQLSKVLDYKGLKPCSVQSAILYVLKAGFSMKLKNKELIDSICDFFDITEEELIIKKNY